MLQSLKLLSWFLCLIQLSEHYRHSHGPLGSPFSLRSLDLEAAQEAQTKFCQNCLCKSRKWPTKHKSWFAGITTLSDCPPAMEQIKFISGPPPQVVGVSQSEGEKKKNAKSFSFFHTISLNARNILGVERCFHLERPLEERLILITIIFSFFFLVKSIGLNLFHLNLFVWLSYKPSNVPEVPGSN